MDQVTQFLTQKNTYIIQAFVVVFGALVLDYIQRRLLNRLLKKAKTTRTWWDDALLSSLKKPISVIIWVFGISFAAQIIQHATQVILFEAFKPLRDIVAIGAISWFLVHLINSSEENILNTHADVDKTTANAIANLLKVSVIIVTILVILQTLGFSISGVLAFGGIGGIAVGFAAKDLLANFFGGLIIYMDRPFAVGDWVRSPDREIEGHVETIGWRVTRIRTFDKRPLYVPNSVFANIALENPSRMLNRRIYETVGIRYDDVAKMGTIVEKVRDMLRHHPEIDTNQTLIVNFNKFAPSSLDFFIYTFTKTINWVRYHEVKQDVLLKVIDIIEGEGAQIAFPTSTIHLGDESLLEELTRNAAKTKEPDTAGGGH